ncbi:MAG: DUF3179 domain-containing protein [Chitinophagales bacterium]|nr:DUF3179 domain-containing protein [Chitinophagales bacterium]
MNYKSPLFFFYFLTLGSAPCLFLSCKPSLSSKNAAGSEKVKSEAKDSSDSTLLKQFDYASLQTDLTKHSIPLDSVFDGGPGKNGIPAIDFPEFISSQQAAHTLSQIEYGIYLEGKTESKFYPFNILNWHEIINDRLDGHPIAVTFCPLCGSAIIYDRVIDSDTLSFGVSGKLYESNLLMFDDKTETLWSQGLGEAVIGTLTGKKLKLLNSSVISFDDVLNNNPGAKVLSVNTGFDRDYSRYPYVQYMNNDSLMFPISKTDNRYFKNKDEIYVVPVGNSSVAFAWKALLKSGKAEVKTSAGSILVKVENNVPLAVRKETGEPLAGYFSFWFSWYALHPNDIVWKGNK